MADGEKPMLTLHAIRVFVEVARSKSFSEAGRHLGLSPGAISRLIASLEDDLRIQLVNRSSRKLRLTEAGTMLRENFQNVIDSVNSVEATAAELQIVPHGTLRVHSRVTFGLHCIIPLIPQFTARHPEICLDFVMTDTDVSLLEDNVEVDIRVGRPQDSTDIVRRIAPSQPVLCASPGYLAKRKVPSSPAELMEHDCLILRSAPGSDVWQFSMGGPAETIQVNGRIRSNSGEALRHLAVGGAGITVLGEWAVRHDIAAGRLIPLLPEYRVSTAAADRDIYLVYRQRSNVPIKIRAFIDFLVGALPEQLAAH